jgi:hypothetical protein
VLAFGPETAPELFKPQQARLPSVRRAQMWEPPALTAVKLSTLAFGPETWPFPSFPQHARRPSVRTAQV